VLRLTDMETPVPKGNEVLVKVHAVSLNATDWEGLRGNRCIPASGARSGRDTTCSGQTSPGGLMRRAAARRASGRGGRVRRHPQLHERVRGARVRAGERSGADAGGLTDEEAAALPQAEAIALQGIQDKGRVQPGQKVLINGGGGGSGMYAVQLAKLHGAEVTGVDNAEKLEFMRSLGADHVIDCTREDFTRNGRTYDLILDLAAHRSAFSYKRSLTPGGRYLYVGGSVATLLQVLALPALGRKSQGPEDTALGRPARCTAPGAHR
jgi:NADPH:quinone reductase-like Zn-dependent oxidoreductase